MFLTIVEVSNIRAIPHTNTRTNWRQDDVACTLIVKACAGEEIQAPIDARVSPKNIFWVFKIVYQGDDF